MNSWCLHEVGKEGRLVRDHLEIVDGELDVGGSSHSEQVQNLEEELRVERGE